ncbi:MAG: coproporphyrinogen III oxidase [Alphaproteobacteria bacterium]|nr:MAG: coproporphyrinogen III oxidase [Alphaproteobacteria bacterium]
MPVSPENLAIYIHWPFCLSKCPYCDFNSHVREQIDEAAFAGALVAELDHYRILSGSRTITSVFFGGGTPSLMAASTVDRLLRRIAQNWTFDKDVEITLEANPTSVEAGKFKDFAAAGINRLSLGIQALNDPDLKALGREHDLPEALAAIDLSRKYFTRTSFDLIYARMGQSLTAWEVELRQALAMAADHLSLYQLTIERGTAFYQAHEKGRIILPTEDVSADMYDLTREICAAHGLPAYEVSNHAARGQESRHNLTYWTYGEYIGIGPGAHGRLSMDGSLHALTQHRSPEKWLTKAASAGHGTDQNHRLTRADMAEEMIMMSLRLTEGLSLAGFEKRIGEGVDLFIDQGYLQRLFELGYMERDDHHLRATKSGMPLLNSLLGRLLAS